MKIFEVFEFSTYWLSDTLLTIDLVVLLNIEHADTAISCNKNKLGRIGIHIVRFAAFEVDEANKFRFIL
jgi:hypothetical protein